MSRARLFAVIFIFTAFAVSYWIVQRIPHSVVLHVNDKWHVMLAGETLTSSLGFYSNQFDLIREDPANLWLRGEGNIKWHQHTITVTESSIRLNSHIIETGMNEAEVNIMFYPDGRVTKGSLKLK